MKGHLRERPKGSGNWAIVIDVRDPQTGKRKRRWHSFKGTKREAQVRCAQLIAEAQGGPQSIPRGSRLTSSLTGLNATGLPYTSARPQRSAMRHLFPLCVATLATGAYRRSGPLILRALCDVGAG